MNRIFEPLPPDHPAIGALQCAVCHMTFQAGDVTMLVPKPGGERDGFTVEADLLHADCEAEIHARRLMKMASFLRELVTLALKFNGPQPSWEADRIAEYEACEAGAAALRADGGGPLSLAIRQRAKGNTP
jgi:hypothetical protein